MKNYGNNVIALLDCFLAVRFGIGTFHNVQLISVGGGGKKILLPEPGHTTLGKNSIFLKMACTSYFRFICIWQTFLFKVFLNINFNSLCILLESKSKHWHCYHSSTRWHCLYVKLLLLLLILLLYFSLRLCHCILLWQFYTCIICE